jgi:hypothetical protein
MKLIPNWRSAGRMLSVQIAALAVLFAALPVDQQTAILALLGLAPERIPGVLGLAIIVARLIDQPAVALPAPNTPKD